MKFPLTIISSGVRPVAVLTGFPYELPSRCSMFRFVPQLIATHKCGGQANKPITCNRRTPFPSQICDPFYSFFGLIRPPVYPLYFVT